MYYCVVGGFFYLGYSCVSVAAKCRSCVLHDMYVFPLVIQEGMGKKKFSKFCMWTVITEKKCHIMGMLFKILIYLDILPIPFLKMETCNID